MTGLVDVFQSWRRHVRTNINGSASMAFGGDCPVTKLSSLYIIGETAGATEAYIFSHGGSFDEDYVFDNKEFTVPVGTSVEFYQPDGYSLRYTATRLRNGPPAKAPEGWDGLSFGEGDSCPNYILTKNQGRHQSSGYTTEDSAQWEMDYDGLQAVAEDTGVLIVTVRNRWFHSGMSLKNVIHDVQGEVPTVKTFHCMFCRVNANSDGWSWTANAAGPGWS
jgi:hypothetical protein